MNPRTTQSPPQLPALLTPAEVIGYLRLDTDGRDPAERLRNLIRRHGLPTIKRGRLQLFRRSAVDAWLDADLGRSIGTPARMVAAHGLTTKTSPARSGRAGFQGKAPSRSRV